MIDLHYWTTPNGHKLVMFLEETGLPYRLTHVNLLQNDQFKDEFLKIAPNNKIPAIVDHAPLDGGEPISLFESGAILLYLADKTGALIPQDNRGRLDAMQWLFWQVAGLGPMAGQYLNFKRAEAKNEGAIERFSKETSRLFGVLNKRLGDRTYLAGEEYSIADIATYPWTAPYKLFEQDLNNFPHLERWLDAVYERPATRRAYDAAKAINPNSPQPTQPRADREAARQTTA